MTKYTALITIITMRILFHPLNVKTEINPFTSQSPNPSAHTAAITTKFLNVNGNIKNDKVLLLWDVTENESADIFEVEKSTDGKTFSLAALVFGTDKINADQYVFFEKVSEVKTLYRIKLIQKNKEIEYSKIIEIKQGA